MSFYQKQLRDPRWQKRKGEILLRDNYTCTQCKATDKTLEVHHLEYLGNIAPWDYPDDMLTTLCEDCHDKELGRGILEKHLSKTLKINGFLYADLIALSCLIETNPNFKEYILTFIRKFRNG